MPKETNEQATFTALRVKATAKQRRSWKAYAAKNGIYLYDLVADTLDAVVLGHCVQQIGQTEAQTTQPKGSQS